MRLFELVGNELIGFFGVRSWIDMATSHDYGSLLTYEGFTSAIGPLLPFLLLFEIIRALVHKNFKVRDYRLIFFTYLTNRVLSSFVSIAAVAIASDSSCPTRSSRVASPGTG